MRLFKQRDVLFGVFSVLSLSIAAWADGLPGEYLLTQRWRDLLAGHSSMHNPAYLADENYLTFRGAGSRTLQGAFYLWELGASKPIGLYQTAGFTWLAEDDGIIESGEFNPATGTIDASSQRLRNQHHFFTASYAINPWHGLCVGANLNIAYLTNFGEPRLGVGADLGLTYRLVRHPIIGTHTPGLFFQNIIPPRLFSVGSGSEIDVGKNFYAVNLKASLMSTYWERRIESGFDLDIKDLYSQGKDFAAAAIGDTGSAQSRLDAGKKKVEVDINGRIGVWILRFFKAYVQFGSQYWGLGGGINAPRVNGGRDLQIIYQYLTMTEGDITNAHTAYVLWEVGKHREEVFARKMARLANVLPNDLYNRALKLYHEGKYWDAFFIFGQIVAQFPDFFKNDYVEYYRGSCLEELDMRATARQTYEDMKKLYPRSEVVPKADLGIMRVDYRNDYNSGVVEQFGLLNQPQVTDSLKFHAYYLMGQTHMKEKEWVKANQVFSVVPEEHPEYVFAQHSMAITNVMLNRLEAAMANLENCLQTKTTSRNQQEMVNRSAVFLGYLFYEQNSLSKAISALRMVEKTSYYYGDALLGTAWTALKARQWVDCSNAGKELIRMVDKPEMMLEGLLLDAYGNFMQKNYVQAATILKAAMSQLTSYAALPQDSLFTRRRDADQERISYDFLSREAKKLSVLDPSSAVMRIVDSLRTQQGAMHKNLKDFARFQDEFHRRSFFARGVDKIREDIEYAEAVVMKLVDKEALAREEAKAREKQQSIDAEIEKLKQQMQQLDSGK